MNTCQCSRDLQLRFIQHLQLGMLDEVVRTFQQHDITYYISGGTYLGAVRHKGFIPWDDDVDVALPREDYERALEILPDTLPDCYELVTYRTRKDFNWLCAQIWDKRLKVRMSEYSTDLIKPCWIDLFPLDGAPAPGPRRKIWELRLKRLELAWGLSRIEESPDSHQGRSAARQRVIDIAHAIKANRFFDSKHWCQKRERALKATSMSKTGWCINAVGAYKFKSIFNVSEIYGEGADYEFCGRQLNGPVSYDAYLTQIYGDYMELPPLDKRNWHGTELLKAKQFAIGYTQGTFDMFHIGHLNLLRKAKEQCDYLIVGVNSDDLVWDYKHKHPVVSIEDRKEILESLGLVDEVIVTHTLDKEAIFESVPFEAVFIGDDWRGDERWSTTESLLAKHGVSVVYLPHTEGVSSTGLRSRVSDRVQE